MLARLNSDKVKKSDDNTWEKFQESSLTIDLSPAAPTQECFKALDIDGFFKSQLAKKPDENTFSAQVFADRLFKQYESLLKESNIE
jgi:hypothetical protein